MAFILIDHVIGYDDQGAERTARRLVNTDHVSHIDPNVDGTHSLVYMPMSEEDPMIVPHPLDHVMSVFDVTHRLFAA